MIKSEIITIDFSMDIEKRLLEKYPNLLRWAIVRKPENNLVVVNLSFRCDIS